MPGRLLPRTLRRPRFFAQRRLRPGLPPTVAQRYTHTASLRSSQPAAAAPLGSACAAAPLASLPSTPEIAPVVAPPIPPAIAPPARALVLRGRFWEVTYGGVTAIVDDCRGLRYIALLVRNAAAGGGPLHAKELVAIAAGQPAGAVELTVADPVLDPVARTQLIARLEDLAAERREATSRNDSSRLTLLDEEYERIADALAEGASAPGRARRGTFTNDGEKARKAVSKAISEAVSKIASHPDLPELAQHLTSAIHKGLWLSYAGGADWEIDAKL